MAEKKDFDSLRELLKETFERAAANVATNGFQRPSGRTAFNEAAII